MVLWMTGAALAGGVEVTATGVRDVSIGLGGTSFDLVLEVTRTGWPGVKLSSLDYVVTVDGQEIERNAAQPDVKLEQNVPTEVVIPCEVSGLAAAGAIVSAAMDGTVDLTIDGTATAWIWFLPLRVGFEEDLLHVDLR